VNEKIAIFQMGNERRIKTHQNLSKNLQEN
jgi:hypothetical protein